MKQLTVITLISLLSLSVKAMDHDIDAQTWCKNVVMGWNLGNALESAGGDWDYDNYAWTNVWEKDYAKWETAWGNPKTTKEMIHALKEHGFNAIRVPVRWVPYADIETMEIDESWIARVKEVVDWCMAEDMQVILNTHHELWLESYPIYTMKETLNGKLRKLWTNIATAFADYDGRLAFAGTNEVTVNWAAPTAENYDVQNSYNQTFIDAVRATGGNNAKRNLIVQTYATDPTYGLAGFVIPNDPTENRLSVEFHYYSPYSYCSGGEDSYFYWGKAFADKGKITPDGNEDTIANLFLKLRKEWWDKGLGIVMGEYGCSHHFTDDDKQTQEANEQYYLETLVSEARKNGFAAFVWDNNAYGNGSEKFGIFNRNNNMSVDAPFFLDGIKEGSKTQFVADVEYNEGDPDVGVGGKVIWKGEELLNWGDGFQWKIAASEFSSFTDQATIVLYYYQDKNASYEDIQFMDGTWSASLPFTVGDSKFDGDFNPRSFYSTIGESHITPMIFTGSSLSKLKSVGVNIQGYGVVLTKIVVMSEPNAILLPTVNPESDDAVYDLRGMKVSTPQDGKVYIVKGKKIIK